MRTRRWAIIVMLVCACAIVGSGCRRTSPFTKGRAGDKVDRLDPDTFREGDSTLFDRPGGDLSGPHVKFDNVLFDYDSAQVQSSEHGKIQAVADYLRSNPRVGVIVAGHCDERGSREYNMALGERRALAVRAYLIGLGIDGSLIQTVSYGKEQPIAAGHDESAWRLNRRAEFSCYNQ